jgi:hypothetical protein
MLQRMVAIGIIYVAIAFAWFVLALSVGQRTYHADGKLRGQVGGLWGEPQLQLSPELKFKWSEKRSETDKVVDPNTKAETLVTRERIVWFDKPVILDKSHLAVDLKLDQRRKGLLWYSTYGIAFRGDYAYVHDDDREGILVITYRFPTQKAIYDNFRLEVNGKVDPKLGPVSDGDAKIVQQEVPVAKGTRVPFAVGYQSRGLDWWKYSFGSDVNRVKDFRLDMTTDFDGIDFPEGTISPTNKEKAGDGWRLVWSSENLISGFMVGMTMPARINPGPLAAEISYFAPVSLAFFFVWMFIITVMKKIELHPMNYLFLGAAFFAFHLLFSYSVDHIEIVTAFAISSAVSVFLVVSYLRLVVGLRFAAIEAGLSQLVYLVFFSYAHFLEGFTGLIVTAGSILTLYFLMQLTGRIKWSEIFARRQTVPQTMSIMGGGR